MAYEVLSQMEVETQLCHITAFVVIKVLTYLNSMTL